MKKSRILIYIVTIISLVLIIIFVKNNYNSSKKGNNIINKSADEIKEYILSIESYEAVAEIAVKSNKNENRYKVIQKYNKEGNAYKQEIIEPENIKGIQIIYDGTNLKIENSVLNISKIYENYRYIESNELSLISFIEDYKNNEKSKYNEEDEKIILETEVKNYNKYSLIKKLYINKEKGYIEKMEIIDRTQNIRIYILYNEIEINTTSKEDVLTFSTKVLYDNI